MAATVPNDLIVDYPSQAVIIDTVLVERSSSKLGNYTPLEPGAPFKKGTHTAAQVTALEGNEFLGQKASADEEWINRFYGKVPSTQDIANWESAYEEGNTLYPSFQRRYLEKRDLYTARTLGSALPGLYRIRVTAAGSGYLVAPTISFSGGTGSGATAIAVLNNSGGIAKITIKSEGNYTVVPTVVITPVNGGSGATATAFIQPTTCILTQEKVTNNAPTPYESLYVVVTRLYETLPGPQILRYGYDSESGAHTITTTQRTTLSSSTSVLGTSITSALLGGITLYALDSSVIPDEGKGAVAATLVTFYMEVPGTRYEYGSERAVCPALFTFISSWATSATAPFRLVGPFAGVNYDLTAKRTVVATVTEITYSLGAPISLPLLWSVISPGAASRFFPISADTIHNAIHVEETAPDLSFQVVEDLPASTPSAYSIGDAMIIHSSAKPYSKGGGVIYEKRVTTAVEPT